MLISNKTHYDGAVETCTNIKTHHCQCPGKIPSLFCGCDAGCCVYTAWLSCIRFPESYENIKCDFFF